VGYPNGGRDILKRFDHLKLLDKIGSVLKNGILKLKLMKPYELKQSLLDRMEIEGLIERIKKLEIELSIKDLQIKALKEDLDYSKQLTLIARINNI
jgi:hypothetical protein